MKVSGGEWLAAAGRCQLGPAGGRRGSQMLSGHSRERFGIPQKHWNQWQDKKSHYHVRRLTVQMRLTFLERKKGNLKHRHGYFAVSYPGCLQAHLPRLGLTIWMSLFFFPVGSSWPNHQVLSPCFGVTYKNITPGLSLVENQTLDRSPSPSFSPSLSF